MKTDLRALLGGMAVVALMGACTDYQPNPIAPCTASPDTIFDIYRDSLRLVVGADEQVWAERFVARCADRFYLGEGGIAWTIRDSSIVGWREPVATPRYLVARAPGRTVLLATYTTSVDSLTVTVPDTVPMGPVGFVAAGYLNSCAVEVDGDALCWGSGTHVLGDAAVSGAIGSCRGSPCSPMPVPIASGIRSVHLGGNHACSLDLSQQARCWGDNMSGQLGTGSPSGTIYQPTAVVGGRAFTTLALASSHTCGIATDGVAYCWGDGHGGRVGAGQETWFYEPTQVAGSHRFVSITAQPETTCAATTDGAILCWGGFGFGAAAPYGAGQCQIQGKGGPILFSCALTPLRMHILTSGADSLFVQVSGACALASQGSVYCYDQALGRYAEKVGAGPFVSLAGSRDYGCALDSAGSAWCWSDAPSAPALAPGGHVFVQIDARSHACGLTTNADVWCWRNNSSGVAGVPLSDTAPVPRRVRGQG